MHVVQTLGVPPNQGRMYLPISGWTWKSRKALKKIVKAKRIIAAWLGVRVTDEGGSVRCLRRRLSRACGLLASGKPSCVGAKPSACQAMSFATNVPRGSERVAKNHPGPRLRAGFSGPARFAAFCNRAIESGGSPEPARRYPPSGFSDLWLGWRAIFSSRLQAA